MSMSPIQAECLDTTEKSTERVGVYRGSQKVLGRLALEEGGADHSCIDTRRTRDGEGW